MTDNQVYPIPADFFDNSSNSSNLLKLDIYPNDFIISNSNSNSNSGIGSIIGLNSNCSNLSINHQLRNNLNSSALSPQQESTLSPQNYSNSASMDSLRENPMLSGSTASIQIPQRSNGNTNGINILCANSNSNSSSNILITKFNNSQPRIIADFSEFGLDALQSNSLSPNLLQQQQQQQQQNNQNQSHQQQQQQSQIMNNTSNDNNRGNINNGGNSGTTNGIILTNNVHMQQSTIPTTTTTVGNSSTPSSTSSSSSTTTAAVANDDGDFILYELQNSNNTIWSDIGNAMITTKTEPFPMDDDYIFQIDKTDMMNDPTLSELNHETLLEDLIIEDLMHSSDHDSYLIGSPNSQLHQMQSFSGGGGSGNSSGGNNSNIHSPENSVPPQQLLQHNSQLLQQQQQFHQQQQQHIQPNQHGIHLNVNRGHHYDDRTNNGSSSPYDIYHSTPTKNFNTNAAFSPGSQTSSSPLLLHSITPPPPHNNNNHHHNHHRSQLQQNRPSRTALHDLLSKKDYSQSPDRHALGQSVPGPSASHILLAGTALSPASSSGFGSSSGRKPISFTSGGGASAAAAGGQSALSRLSSSAPTHLGFDQIWQRREPRQHLLSTGSLVEAESFSSISTGSVLSPEGNDFSHDEEGYSDYDSDHYEDYSSDGSINDDDNRNSASNSNNNNNNKNKERFFWQYNVQAKGPKGQRLVIKTQLEDPHVLNEVTDPVFSPNCSVRGIKHSGKARKGDGNDLTPNPRKLHAIGKELDKLGRTINDMIPVSELPFNVRPKSRKEKNKLASRACRLKKKAQHEANKIKLYGLEVEHKKLLNGISDCKRILAMKYQSQCPNQNQSDARGEINNKIEKIAHQSTTVQIAGNSTEFVNKILDKVKAGHSSGGLEDLKSM